MQSMDELNKILKTEEIDLGDANDLVKKIKEAEEAGAVQHRIGKLPQSGEFVEINGLQYRVVFGNYVKGKYTVKVVLR